MWLETMLDNKKDNIFMPEDHMEELYNSKNLLVRFVHTNRLNQIIKCMPSKNGIKVLDAGCGEGHLIEKLNKKNFYYGVDITDIALQKAKKRCPHAEFYKMDLSKIDFNDGFFDVVICTEVLEHIFDYKKVINELKRVLKKDGYLILTFPNEMLWILSRFFLRRKPIKVPDHVNSFVPKKIKSLVNMELTSKVNLPFRLPFLISLGCLMKFKKQ